MPMVVSVYRDCKCCSVSCLVYKRMTFKVAFNVCSSENSTKLLLPCPMFKSNVTFLIFYQPLSFKYEKREVAMLVVAYIPLFHLTQKRGDVMECVILGTNLCKFTCALIRILSVRECSYSGHIKRSSGR